MLFRSSDSAGPAEAGWRTGTWRYGYGRWGYRPYWGGGAVAAGVVGGLALGAVDNALLADPTDQPARRLRVNVLDAIPER